MLVWNEVKVVTIDTQRYRNRSVSASYSCLIEIKWKGIILYIYRIFHVPHPAPTPPHNTLSHPTPFWNIYKEHVSIFVIYRDATRKRMCHRPQKSCKLTTNLYMKYYIHQRKPHMSYMHFISNHPKTISILNVSKIRQMGRTLIGIPFTFLNGAFSFGLALVLTVRYELVIVIKFILKVWRSFCRRFY